MNVKRIFFKTTSFIVLVAFLFNNIAYAAPPGSDTLRDPATARSKLVINSIVDTLLKIIPPAGPVKPLTVEDHEEWVNRTQVYDFGRLKRPVGNRTTKSSSAGVSDKQMESILSWLKRSHKGISPQRWVDLCKIVEPAESNRHKAINELQKYRTIYMEGSHALESPKISEELAEAILALREVNPQLFTKGNFWMIRIAAEMAESRMEDAKQLLVIGIAPNIATHEDKIFVADDKAGRIRVFDIDTCEEGADIKEAGIQSSSDVTVMKDTGIIYVADNRKYTIIAYERDTGKQISFEQPIETGFVKELLSDSGTLYVLDTQQNRVRKFDAETGKEINFTQRPVNVFQAEAIAKADDKLFVVDGQANAVRTFNADTGEEYDLPIPAKTDTSQPKIIDVYSRDGFVIIVYNKWNTRTIYNISKKEFIDPEGTSKTSSACKAEQELFDKAVTKLLQTRLVYNTGSGSATVELHLYRSEQIKPSSSYLITGQNLSMSGASHTKPHIQIAVRPEDLLSPEALAGRIKDALSGLVYDSSKDKLNPAGKAYADIWDKYHKDNFIRALTAATNKTSSAGGVYDPIDMITQEPGSSNPKDNNIHIGMERPGLTVPSTGVSEWLAGEDIASEFDPYDGNDMKEFRKILELRSQAFREQEGKSSSAGKATIIFNDESLPAAQQEMLVSLLGEDSPSLKKLEAALNVRIKLESRVSPIDMQGNMVIISDKEIDGYPQAKQIIYDGKIAFEKAYIPVAALIIMANAISLGIKDEAKLKETMEELLLTLSKEPQAPDTVTEAVERAMPILGLSKVWSDNDIIEDFLHRILEMPSHEQREQQPPTRSSSAGALDAINEQYSIALKRLAESENHVDAITELKEVASVLFNTSVNYSNIKLQSRNDDTSEINEAKLKSGMAAQMANTIASLVTYGVRLQEYEGVREFKGKPVLEKHRKTIPWLLDKTTVLGEQLEIAQKVGELAEIENRIGAKAILCDPKNDNIKDLLIANGFDKDTPAIAISSVGNQQIFKEAGVKVLPIDKFRPDQYIDLSQIAIYSKLMLYIATIDDPNVTGKLQSLAINLHETITGQKPNAGDFERFLQEGVMVLAYSLPEPSVKYQQGQLEQLHMRAVEALKAA